MKVWGPLLIWSLVIILEERWLPQVLILSGLTAAAWVYPPRWVYPMALWAGLAVDLTWGRSAGVSSLLLILGVLGVQLIKSQFNQWWVMLITAWTLSLGWQWWFSGQFDWGLWLLTGGLTYVWWGWFKAVTGSRGGVYLKGHNVVG